MAHLTVRASYQKLADRINRYPQGAPPTKVLYKILQMLFSEDEAEYVSLLPIKPFGLKMAAILWKKSEKDAQVLLDKLCGRGILLDINFMGKPTYCLPPPMAGFFEFSMMRLRNDIDQKVLAELLHQYLNVEDDFVRELFTGGKTPIGRIFVNEQALSTEHFLRILDYERATEVIKTATCIGVGICYCRHKMEHMGQACKAPMDICMTFNSVAGSLTRHGIARKIDEIECMDLLDQAYELNLLQWGENNRRSVNFICNCCGCCCEALLAAKRFSLLNPVATTNYLPVVDESTCTGCAKCVDICPVEAMTLISASDPNKPKRKLARLNHDICLGCGVCVRVCKEKSLRLSEREGRVITPLNGAHRAVIMAIERGKLQELIFDNQAMTNHRAMAAILGVILKLPPIKQILANKQIQSRYLEFLILKMENKTITLDPKKEI